MLVHIKEIIKKKNDGFFHNIFVLIKINNKITELRTILQRESQNS